MSRHHANICWRRGSGDFTGNRYSRAHVWEFDGGARIDASPSPDIVPVPMSVPEFIDPEEAFVASIASCHMLFFLSIAASRGFIVDEYSDAAEGMMQKNQNGRMAITRVTLNPAAIYSGAIIPTTPELEQLHHQSHEMCFIANSVMTEITTRIRS